MNDQDDEIEIIGALPRPNVPSGYVQIVNWEEATGGLWLDKGGIGFPIDYVTQQFHAALDKGYSGEMKIDAFSMAYQQLKKSVSLIEVDEAVYPKILYCSVHFIVNYENDMLVNQFNEMLESGGGELRFRWFYNGDFSVRIFELGASPTVN